jgi:hypothetical protein
MLQRSAHGVVQVLPHSRRAAFHPIFGAVVALKISSDMLKQALIFFWPMMVLVGAQIAPLDCGLPLPASPQWSGTSRSIDEVRGLIPPISTQLTE